MHATRANATGPRPSEVRRGGLYWVEPDVARGSVPGRPHPHLVIQDAVAGASGGGVVVVCALTSNLHRATEPGNVLLDVGEGGLAKQSVLVVSQVAEVELARVGVRIGALSDQRVEQVLAGMRFQQTSFFQR